MSSCQPVGLLSHFGGHRLYVRREVLLEEGWLVPFVYNVESMVPDLSRPDGYVACPEVDFSSPENLFWAVIGLSQKVPGCVASDHGPVGPVRSGHMTSAPLFLETIRKKVLAQVLPTLTGYMEKEAPKYTIELFWDYLTKTAKWYTWLIV